MTNEKLDFNIDNDRIYLWDKKNIFYYEFYRLFKDENKIMLGFKISEKDKTSTIKQVQPGDCSDIIAIEVEQPIGSLILCWSLEIDAENNAHEV